MTIDNDDLREDAINRARRLAEVFAWSDSDLVETVEYEALVTALERLDEAETN